MGPIVAIRVFIYIYTHTCMYMYTYTHVHTHMYIHIYYMYIHTYTPMFSIMGANSTTYVVFLVAPPCQDFRQEFEVS